jgi:glycosyltransferase involved in cell wall biosynthesis
MVYGPEVDAWTRACRRHPRLGRIAGVAAGIPSTLDLGGAALWHFNSRHTRDEARAAGWELPQTEITPAGIDSTLFRAQPEEPWAWRLLCAGRLDRRKGVDLAIAALAELPDETTLTIAGGGEAPYESELRELVESRGLTHRVEFTGPLDRRQMAASYRRADAVLFPVRWQEPWGLVPLEAMAVGRPVVATGTGGSAEYLRDGRTCMIVPVDDGTALAAAVRKLSADAQLRRRLRDGGLETAARHTGDAFNTALQRSIEGLLA